jgi:hypothetical protein
VPAGAAEYNALRTQVEAKLNQLKAHAQKDIIQTEIGLFDTKMAAATAKANAAKYAEAKQLLTQVNTAITAVAKVADKAVIAKKHYADWVEKPLARLKANPQKAQITAEIAAVEAKKTRVDAQITARKFDQAEVLMTEIFFDCDAAAKSIIYKAARAAAEAKIDALKKHAHKGDVDGEIAELDGKLKEAATAAKGKKYDQAIALMGQVPILSDRATALADKLQATAAKVPEYAKAFKDGGMKDAEAAKAANYAHKILAGENCDDAKAIKMAKTAMTLSKEGFSDDRAVLGAKVNQALLDDGMDADKAGVITRITKMGGTATAEDAKTVARGMKVFPAKMLKSMKDNKTNMVACEGAITDYRTDLKGVHPRDWPKDSTWDDVPGAHLGDKKEVAIGTMDDGHGKRKVPGPGEGSVKHGAYNLIAHEGGHGFDMDGTPVKNKNADFRKARKKDIDDGNLVAPRDKYFLQPGNAGFEETFAESCARHFGGDANMATDWPELKNFWVHNPWQ